MSSITILNQIIDDEQGSYRIRHGDRVGYLTINVNVFDEDTMCRPYLLIPNLPELPHDGWTRLTITRSGADGALQVNTTNDSLPGIETLWHPQHIDVLSLERDKRYRSNVHEVIYNGRPAIAKIAAFEWEIPRLERETWAYMELHQQQQQQPQAAWICPRVLGHLAESGRFASASDLLNCTEVVDRLHRLGLTHGDVNRYNFIVDERGGRVRMVDFEHAAAFEEEAARDELKSLEAELSEDTGRGGPAVLV